MQPRRPRQDRASKLVVVQPTRLLKLDLGCGQHPHEDYEGVDLYAEQAKHKVNLFSFPFPWADNSVEAIHCSHFLEHLPAREVEERDVFEPGGDDGKRFWGQDFLLAFLDECYRVLVPDGVMKAIVPCARSNRGFQDPTHRRFFVAETFLYFSKGWRELQGLGHYPVRCNFDVNVIHSCFEELQKLHPEASTRRFNHEWNTIIDWHATLIAKK